MTLQACLIHEPGYRLILDGPPPTDVIRNAFYLPEVGESRSWGVFGRDRRLVGATGYYRGPGPHLPFQEHVTSVDLDAVHATAPEATYFYGGRVVPHYGHFLLGCLPRLWRLSTLPLPRPRILIHSPHDVEALFAYSHIAAIFGALGLTSADFVRPTEIMHIPELIAPWPSFEEGHLAYSDFAALCHLIGERLLDGANIQPVNRPVYFSKERMTTGISRLLNEKEFADVLRANGVDVVFPETLSLRDQLRIFAERRVITGSFGSVFHSSIFVPTRTMLMLNWGNTVYRNFTLVDAINGNDTHYVFPNDDIEVCGTVGGFGANWRLRHPAWTAEQFLRATDALSGQDRALGLVNLAHRRPTRQSSYAEEHQPANPDQVSMAVSGRLSAQPAFHTSHEVSPWWQVDLERTCRITRIRLFNVVGPAIISERAARMRILVSADGHGWTEIARRLDPTPFGGIDGQPFEFDPPGGVTAQFVRIELLLPNFFHLDQVQVFGHPA